MFHSRLDSCFGAALLAVLLSELLRSPALPAPLPKDKPTLRVSPAGEIKLADLRAEDAALIDENTVVLVGTKPDEEVADPNRFVPRGAIVDLAKKTSRPFTNGHTAWIYRDPVLRIWDVKAGKSIAAIDIEKPEASRFGVACFHTSDRIAIAVGEQVIVLDPTKPDERMFVSPDNVR